MVNPEAEGAGAEQAKCSASAGRRWLGWLRNGVAFVLLFWAMLSFQSRNMLDTDGEITIQSFILPSLAGESVTVAPQDERSTLIYFFAPWCSVCRNTIGHLESVDTERNRIVVIALDWSDIQAVEQFVDATGLSYPVLLGTRDTRELFQVQAYPSYYVLDRDFRVVDRAMGYLTVLDLKLQDL